LGRIGLDDLRPSPDHMPPAIDTVRPQGGDIRRVEGAIGATSGLTIRDREADLCIWLGERGAGLPGLL
jgi:hypothetical protein